MCADPHPPSRGEIMLWPALGPLGLGRVQVGCGWQVMVAVLSSSPVRSPPACAATRPLRGEAPRYHGVRTLESPSFSSFPTDVTIATFWAGRPAHSSTLGNSTSPLRQVTSSGGTTHRRRPLASERWGSRLGATLRDVHTAGALGDDCACVCLSRWGSGHNCAACGVS